jgi:hypothetical protein
MNNHFERLEKLYNSLETLKEEGLELDQNVIEKIQKIEESIITDEIVPLVAETIEPIIKNIRRELLILIEYKPGEDLAVKLTKKRSIIIPAENERVTTLPRVTSYNIPLHGRGPNTDLSVRFSDGTVIAENTAAETFVRVIEKIGLETVRQLNIKMNRHPLVSKERIPVYTPQFLNGYYIQTHCNNPTKKRKLEEIADQLRISLQITIH